MARERATDTKALVSAAAKTFRQKGYRSSTIDDIADAAGISRPTVYKYTRTKRHLLDMMVEQITSDLDHKRDEVAAMNATPLARLRAMIMAHIHAASANRTFYAIVFTEEAELSGEARTLFRTWAHRLTQDFAALLDECVAAQGASKGGEPELDTRIAANLLVSMLSNVYRWYDPEGRVPPAELADQIWLLIGHAFENS